MPRLYQHDDSVVSVHLNGLPSNPCFLLFYKQPVWTIYSNIQQLSRCFLLVNTVPIKDSLHETLNQRNESCYVIELQGGRLSEITRNCTRWNLNQHFKKKVGHGRDSTKPILSLSLVSIRHLSAECTALDFSVTSTCSST